MQLTTHIAGIPHRKPDLSKLAVGHTVQIVPEPDNKFDPNALKVLHSTVHLGYIPRDQTDFWKDKTEASIIQVDPSNKWKEVYISA